MPYREVIRAKKFGGRFAGHARQHAHLVATGASAPFRDQMLPDQEFPDLLQYQVFLGERLDGMHAHLTVIDNRHAFQLEVARQLRDQREHWVRRLREQLFKLKDTTDGSFRPGATRLIFQEDPPRLPNDPLALHQVAERVYQTLTAPGFALESSQPGVVVNPEVLAEGFATELHGLGATVTELQDAESAIGRTQSEKDEHLEALQAYNGNVARFYEALYVLAGQHRLARRLRRSSHLQPASGEPVDDEPGSGPAPATDDQSVFDEEVPPAATADGETTEEADA